MSKQIVFDQEAKEKLKNGVNKLANAVTVTLGPNGRNVIIEKEYGQLHSTKDGVTVAKSITLSDPLENAGAQILKQASIKVAEQAGDGTTTTTLLAQKLINEGLQSIKRGTNAVEVKKGMEKACKLVVKELKKISKEILDENQLKQVAKISSNNDEEIGNLVSTAMSKVGRDGVVTVEESKTGETILEIVEGLQFNKGYKSPYFVTNNNKMQAELKDALVLLYDKSINQVEKILPILENISQQDKSLLIIAESIDGQALATLVVNKMRGNLKVCAVSAPEFGERRTHILEDIAILTGGQVVSFDKGMKLDEFNPEWFGQARVVTVGKDTTTIVDGKGTEDAITKRILEIKNQIDNSSSPYEIEKLQDRLSKMVGGVAIINVGGANEIEIKEKKDRIEDALQATKSALEEGILPGGGITFIRIAKTLDTHETRVNFTLDEEIGLDLVIEALNGPFLKILENAGYDFKKSYKLILDILDKEDSWIGYDCREEIIVDTFKNGIIDPTKVLRCTLENAIAVAGTILITEALVINEPSKDDKKESVDYSQLGM
ncbi:MAG TPA: chaperonin GroEL [Nitrososphaeraceae archaeon]|nr:chaperonin GroEL [Nitrososphaeraceae archaeon]